MTRPKTMVNSQFLSKYGCILAIVSPRNVWTAIHHLRSLILFLLDLIRRCIQVELVDGLFPLMNRNAVALILEIMLGTSSLGIVCILKILKFTLMSLVNLFNEQKMDMDRPVVGVCFAIQK